MTERIALEVLSAKPEPKISPTAQKTERSDAGSAILGEDAPSSKTSKREPLLGFLVLAVFSIGLNGQLFYEPPSFSNWQDWIIVVGAIFCPALTVALWRILRNDWGQERQDQVIMRTLGYTALAPIILVMAVIAGLALYSSIGWFGTIPSWAAVIIILLYLNYLKK